jgi:non-ribosomal peptide synthetase component F
VPFDRVVNRLGVPRDLSRTVVFQAMFQLEPTGAATLDLDGAEVAPLDVGHRSAQVDLSLEVAWGTGGAQTELVYSTDLFDATMIGNLADDLVRVLEAACASPNVPLSCLGLAKPTPRRAPTK